MRLFLFLLALTAAPLAAAETPLVPTPDGRFAARAHLEGMAPELFLIDTGDWCSLSPAYAKRKEMAVLMDVAIGVAPPFNDISAYVTPKTILDRRSTAFHYARQGGPYAPSTAGTIGACVLANAVVVFDPLRMRLDVRGAAQSGQPLVGNRARLVRAERVATWGSAPVLAIRIRLNNAEGVAIVSTGARRSIINRRFAAAAGIDTGEEAAASTLDIAGWTHPKFNPLIDDEASFALRGLADRPAMILGLDALGGYRLVIDYPRDRIWFDPG